MKTAPVSPTGYRSSRSSSTGALRSRRFILAASIAALTGAIPAKTEAADFTWDANAAAAPNPFDGGGTWNTTGLNWWNGSAAVAWSNSVDNIAIFGASTTVPAGIPGNINVTGALTAGGLVFNPYVGNAVKYNITGGTSLTLGGAATITMNTDWVRPFAAINTVLSGSSGLTVQGNGSGILEIGSQANTFTGTVTLQSGAMVSVGSNSGLGAAANAVNFTGNATLIGRAANFSLGSARTFTISPGATATFDAVGAANTMTVAGVIGGSGNFQKKGQGTVALTAANSYTGETRIHQGTLSLNFNDPAAPATNIINPASALRLSGGALNTVGKDSTANTQTFNGVTISGGSSTITGMGGFGGTMTVNLGAITREAGGTVHVASVALPTSGAGMSVTTSSANVNGIIGGYATAGDIGFDEHWATVTAGVIERFSAYQTNASPASWLATDNVDLQVDASGPVGNATINSLRFSNMSTVAIGSGNTLTISSGGILNTGFGSGNISGGTIRGAAGADLIVHQHNAFAPLTIASVIADNGGATGLTKAGTGTLVLSGANTYSGNTFLNGGVLEAHSNAALGTGSTVTSRAGTTLRFAGTSAITSSKNFLFDYGADSFGSAALGGGPDPIGNFNVNVTNTAGVTISGAFNVTAGTMVKSGEGSLTLTNSGVNNLARLNGGIAFTMAGGTLTFDGGAASEWRIGQGEFTIGDNTPVAAAVNINSGKVSAGSWVSIGRGNGTAGLASGVNVNGGSLNTGHLYTGFANGVGGYNVRPFVTASGTGIINVSDDFRASESPGSMTTVTLSGDSALNISDRLELGFGGKSVMTINDNARVVAGGMGIGNGNNAVGNQGAGAVFQNGGSFSRGGAIAGGDWRIGGVNVEDKQVYGLYQMKGGTLNTGAQNFQIGAYGVGVLDISGTAVVNAANNGGFPVIGRYAGAAGVLNISGNATFNSNGTGQRLLVGEDGAGVINISGGTLTVLGDVGPTGAGGGNGGIRLGHAAAGSGTLNVNGGTVQTKGIAESNASARSYLYLNGGVVKAGANNPTFLQGLDNAVVGAGGAVFDTNAFDITIAQNLVPRSGSGVTSIEVTDGGAGYIGQPIVEITGDGTGASAVANVDPATGRVTSITITNPGINYSTAPTITLRGGGTSTPAIVGAVSLGFNAVTGGLTKNGAGTLTLSGFNSYTGVTRVNGGTLTVTGSNAAGGGVAVASGATLNLGNNGFTGDIFGPATIDGTLNFNRADDIFYAEPLTGSGTINKLNTNTLTMDGAPAFTGTLNVNAGKLAASGNFGATVAVNNTARLVPVAGTGTLTVGGLSLNNGSVTDFEFGAGTNDTIVITAANGLSFGTAFTLNFYEAGGTVPFSTTGSYLLFDYSGSFTGDLANLVIGNPISGKGYALVNDAGSTAIRLQITDTTVTSWTVDGSGLWGTAGNWSAGVPNGAGAEAVFGNVITSPASIDIGGNKTVGKLVFNNSNAYTVSGTGTLTLDNGAAAGLVTVNQGNHVIAVPVSIAANTSVTTAAGSSLQLGDISGAKSLSFGGEGKVILSGSGTYTDTNVSGGTLQVGVGGTTGTLGTGPVTLASTTARLAFKRSDAITIAHNISGTGGIAHEGTGALTYTGNASYAGMTQLGEGAFINEGTINGTSQLDIDNTTTLRGSSSTTVAGPTTIAALKNASLNIEGGANASLNGPVTVGSGFGVTGSVNISTTGTVSTSGNVGVGTFFGSIGTLEIAAGTVTQTGGSNIFIGQNGGAGTFTMTGGNLTAGGGGLKFGGGSSDSVGTGTISGGTINTGGEIWVGNNFGNTATVNISGGSVSASNWIAIGRQNATGTVNLTGGSLNKSAGGGHIIIGSLGGTGVLKQSGASVLTSANDVRIGENAGATPSLDSKWEINGGTATIGGTLNVAWNSSTASFDLINGDVTAARLVVGGEMGNAQAGPAKGTVNIKGGTLTINGNGESRIGGDIANGATAEGTLNVEGGTINSPGTFQIGGYGIGTLNMSGGTFTTGNWTAVGRFAGSNGTINLSGGTLSHTNDSTGFLVGEDGKGTVNLSGTGVLDVRNLRVGHGATGNGTVNLDGGTLATKYVQKSNLGSTAAFNFNGGLLKASENSNDFFLGFQDSELSVREGGAKIDTNGFNIAITPGLSGVGGLTKQGAGELVLRGLSSYAGPTNVLAGDLIVSGSLTGTAGVNVSSGATLGGGGIISTINNGNVVLAAGAQLEPGDAFVSTLEMFLGTGKFDLSAAAGGNGYLKFELGEFASDRLSISTGVLAIGNGLDLDDFSFTKLQGFGVGTYTLFDTNTDIQGTLGTNLNGLVAGLNVTLGFAGGANGRNDLVLTVVPEPSAALMLVIGAGAMAGMRRRRRFGCTNLMSQEPCH